MVDVVVVDVVEVVDVVDGDVLEVDVSGGAVVALVDDAACVVGAAEVWEVLGDPPWLFPPRPTAAMMMAARTAAPARSASAGAAGLRRGPVGAGLPVGLKTAVSAARTAAASAGSPAPSTSVAGPADITVVAAPPAQAPATPPLTAAAISAADQNRSDGSRASERSIAAPRSGSTPGRMVEGQVCFLQVSGRRVDCPSLLQLLW